MTWTSRPTGTSPVRADAERLGLAAGGCGGAGRFGADPRWLIPRKRPRGPWGRRRRQRRFLRRRPFPRWGTVRDSGWRRQGDVWYGRARGLARGLVVRMDHGTEVPPPDHFVN